MLQLFISDKGCNVITCPVCERELLPAYRTEEGLEVGYWYDFDPGDVKEGLLVCGDFNCEYEEPVVFTKDRVDAVALSIETTLTQFEDENSPGMPASAASEFADEVESVFKATGRPKLRCAVDYYRQIAESRLEVVEDWLKEAGDQYDVAFYAENGEVTGRILSHTDEEIILATGDDQILTFAKGDLYFERIQYPHRPIPGRVPGEHHFIACVNGDYIVVEGYHLEHASVEENGMYLAHARDPAVGEALRMKKLGERFYEGYFHRDEIERFYHRRNMVRIQGYWLRDGGRTMDHQFVDAETTNPEVARVLDMAPRYNWLHTDFGMREGDEIVCYRDLFPVSAVEETSWYEEPQPLPTYEDYFM